MGDIMEQLVIKGDIEIPEFFSPLAKDLLKKAHEITLDKTSNKSVAKLVNDIWNDFKRLPRVSKEVDDEDMDDDEYYSDVDDDEDIDFIDI